jgi:REP element-mobilizing transposase RayT
MGRGLERRSIFGDDKDRRRWLERLGELPSRFGVVVHGYVLMDNHYHLLVETPQANLSQAVQWLNVSYSVGFNRRHQRVGPLFAGRFKAKLVEADSALLEVSRYIHLNVVRRRAYGLGKAAQPNRRQGIGDAPAPVQVAERLRALRGYGWSSYRSYLGIGASPDWLECRRVRAMVGGRTQAEQRRNYRDYVEQAVREGLPEDQWQRMERAVVIGGGEFVERMRKLVHGERLEQPEMRWFGGQRDFARVKQVVERIKGEPWSAFAERYGDWGRDLGLWLGRRHGAMTLKELAQEAGLSNYRGVGTVIKNFERRLHDDPTVRGAAHEAVKLMTCET